MIFPLRFKLRNCFWYNKCGINAFHGRGYDATAASCERKITSTEPTLAGCSRRTRESNPSRTYQWKATYWKVWQICKGEWLSDGISFASTHLDAPVSSAFVFLGRLYFVLFWTFSFWLCFWLCCVCTPRIVLLWTLSFWICFVCWYVHQWFYTKAWDGCVAVSICPATESWTRWNVSPPTATSCIRMVLSRSNSIDTSGCDRRTSFRKSSGP